MTDLSDEARDLFHSARKAHEPSEQDQRAVHEAVLVRVGAIAAAGSLARAGSGVGAGKGIFATKLVVSLALVGSVGTGAYVATRSPAESSPTVPVVQSNAVASSRAPAASANPPPLLPAVDEPLGEPPSPARNRRSPPIGRVTSSPIVELEPAVSAFPDLPSAAPPATAPSSSVLTLEAQGLSKVEQALRGGRGAEALALLDQQERAFSGGKLDLERQAARIIALCDVGRQGEARALAARFLARAPSSFLAARVRNTCAGQ